MSEKRTEYEVVKNYSLPVFHGIAWVAHLISLIMAQTAKDNDTLVFKLTEINETTAATQDMTGALGNLKPTGMLTASDSMVLAMMTIHLFRRAMFSTLGDVYNMGEKGKINFLGYVASLVHIAIYSISHFLAVLAVLLTLGNRDDFLLLLILAAIVVAETIQHLSANPYSNISYQSKRMLAVVGMVPLVTAGVRIFTAGMSRADSLPGIAATVIVLLAAEAMKLFTEIFTQSQKPGFPKGEAKSRFATSIDSRHMHVVLDLTIKILVVWYVHLSNYISQSIVAFNIKDMDAMKDSRNTVGWIMIVFPSVFTAYMLLGSFVGAPKLLATGDSFFEFPAATMDEKERMLQVA